MQLQLKIYHDQNGGWLFRGLPQQPVCRFEDLAEGLECAKQECLSAPALIELYMDGLYAVIHQDRGWPHQLCRPQSRPRISCRYEGARQRWHKLTRATNEIAVQSEFRLVWDAVCRMTRRRESALATWRKRMQALVVRRTANRLLRRIA
jgi:hypothetical protein